MFNRDGCVQIFRKRFRDFVDDKILEKSCLNQNPQNEYQRQYAEQKLKEYFRYFFQENKISGKNKQCHPLGKFAER